MRETGIHALLADRSRIYGAGIAQLLADAGGIGTVTILDRDADLVATAAHDHVDLLAVEWARLDESLDAVRALRGRSPRVTILIYGVPVADRALVRLLRVEAEAVIDRSCDVAGFQRAVAALLSGTVRRFPQIVPARTEREQTAGPDHAGRTPAPPPGDLTEREREVLCAVAAGWNNREAAARLGISEHTVRAHLRSLSQKLSLRNRVQAASAALRLGLLIGASGGHLAEQELVSEPAQCLPA